MKKQLLIIGIIVLLITVGLSGCTKPNGDPTTPIVNMIANPVNHSCTITVENMYHSSTQWENVWYTLTDITNEKKITSGTLADTSTATIILPRTGQIKDGQTITISPAGVWDQGNPLENNTRYSFTLIYNVTTGTMGSVSWTQPQNNQTNGNEDNLKPEIQIIEVSGMNVVQTINNINNPVKLIVSGENCIITVTQDTNLTEVIISGMNSIVRVSHNHTFISTVSGLNAEIVYYD